MSLMRRGTYLVCLALALSSPLAAGHAQRGSIFLSVAVRDASTGEPLTGAEVTIRDAKLQGRTDSLGRVLFSNVAAVHHRKGDPVRTLEPAV